MASPIREPADSPPIQFASNQDRETATRRVVVDAQRMFGDRADAATLERYARDAVAELWTDSVTITQFIPALAVRQIRDILQVQHLARHCMADCVEIGQ